MVSSRTQESARPNILSGVPQPPDQSHRKVIPSNRSDGFDPMDTGGTRLGSQPHVPRLNLGFQKDRGERLDSHKLIPNSEHQSAHESSSTQKSDRRSRIDFDRRSDLASEFPTATPRSAASLSGQPQLSISEPSYPGWAMDEVRPAHTSPSITPRWGAFS